MISPPYSNFLDEVSLYLKIRVLELKTLFGNDCEYLYLLCDKAYKRFRRRFRRICRKSGLATYMHGENVHKCFLRYRCSWSDLAGIINRKQNDSGISLLWNCCVNVLVLYPPKKWEKATWDYLYRDKGFIVIFLSLSLKLCCSKCNKVIVFIPAAWILCRMLLSIIMKHTELTRKITPCLRVI